MRLLGYSFLNSELLEQALTHRSRGAKNYERLEFLGDSILGFVVARWLYDHFPEQSEGKLSRMRSTLVRKETLAEVARKLELGKYLILGEGEAKSGGFNRDSILSDSVESIIGAIYLDSDFEQASDFIHSHFADHLKNITPQTNHKDPKSQLQEALQKRGMSLPKYTIVNAEGQDHDQVFTVLCCLNELPIEAEAQGKSRRQAEQGAATIVLEQLLKAG